MATLKIPDSQDKLQWSYDREADVLYISSDRPPPGVGIDLGNGLVVRYQEDSGELLGLTVIGLRQRLRERLVPAP